MSEDISIAAFERHISVTKSKRTARTYGRGAKKLMAYLDYAGLSDDPVTWPPSLMDSFVAWMVNEEELSGNTIKLMVIGTKLYLRFYRKRDPAVPTFEDPSIPKIKAKQPTVLGRNALRSYIDLVLEEEEDPIRTAMLLLPLTGLRSEELLTMKMSQIEVQPDPDFIGRVWIIFDVVHGKGDKRRSVPLLQEANIYLRQYLSGWRANTRQDEDWLFPGGHRGRHMTTRALRERVAMFRRRHNIEELSPHSLRATYLTLLDRHGITSLTVAQLAGHMRPEGKQELQTLRKHYVHHDVAQLMKTLAEVRV
jgi:site-specific recombinase XerD